jgi:NAD(P)H-hydrate repair Nnr-like enzyme with NAD(P)H-hydrate epimerase domain
MMENAGVGAAEYICTHVKYGQKVYVFCGRGNNGVTVL